MLSGLYAAASGMLAVESRQDIFANNIANSSTPGFRRHEPVQMGFYEIFTEKLRTPFLFDAQDGPAGGVRLTGTRMDMTAGVLRASDNPTHMALSGPGFFVVDTPAGERYTRSGDFTIDTDGHLATAEGFLVLDNGGAPIKVTGGELAVGSDGSYMIGGVAGGALGLVEFEHPDALVRMGDNLFGVADGTAPAAAVETTVNHKELEMSNVSLPRELLSMTLAMRAYEANQKVVHAFDETMSRLIDRVATPG